MFLPFLKTAARIGSIAAKFSGILATGFGIRQIWNNSSEEIGWQSKAILSTLYTLHIGSITLATAVLLGATDVSAPVGTALVCCTALLKGVADHLVEKSHYSGLTRKQDSLERQLSANNNDFRTTLTLIEDLKETDDFVDTLQKQLDEYHGLLKQMTRSKSVHNLWNDLLLNHQAVVAKNKIIKDFFSQVSFEYFDPDAVIKNLLLEAASLRESMANPSRLHEISIIQLQCIRYKRVASILKEINHKLHGFSQQGKQSQLDFLLKRKTELEWRLLQLKEGDALPLSPQLIAKIRQKEPAFHKKLLIQFVKDKIHKLSAELTKEQLLLVEKKVFLSRPIDFSSLIVQFKNVSVTQNQLSLVRHSESTKAKNVDLGAASAVMALVLAVIPSAEITKYLNPLMLSIGVIAGLVSLSDLYFRYKITRRMTQHETTQMRQFIRQKKFQIAKLGDEGLRTLLIKQLDDILQDDGPISPIASEQLFVNKTRVAKLKAKTRILEMTQDVGVKKNQSRVRARHR